MTTIFGLTLSELFSVGVKFKQDSLKISYQGAGFLEVVGDDGEGFSGQ